LTLCIYGADVLDSCSWLTVCMNQWEHVWTM